MTTIAAPSANQVQSTLTAAFTRGTSTTLVLTDGSLFPSPTPLGHVVYVHNADESKWCLVIYTSRAVNTLTMGGGAADYALAKNVSIGDEAHEFAIGSVVELVCAADELALLFATKVTATEAGGNWDLGAHDWRARNVTADALTAERVVYTGTDGLLSVSAGLLWDETNKCLEIIGAATGSGDIILKVTDGVTGGFFAVSEGSSAVGAFLPSFELHSIGVDGLGGSIQGIIPVANDVYENDRAAVMIQGKRDGNAVLQLANIFAINNYSEKLLIIDVRGNVALNTITIDGTAEKSFTMAAGTAPAAHTDDQAYLWVEDAPEGPGYAALHMMGENAANSYEQIVVGAVVKGTTGRTATPNTGMIEINSFDEEIWMFGDAVWTQIGIFL